MSGVVRDAPVRCGPDVAPGPASKCCLLLGLGQLADEDTADDGQDCADNERPDPGADRGGDQLGLLPNVLDALLDVEVVGDGHDSGDGPSNDGGSLQQCGQVSRGELSHADQDGDDSEDEGDDAVAAFHAVSADGSYEGRGGGEPWQKRP
jgi:hypothetical protein